MMALGFFGPSMPALVSLIFLFKKPAPGSLKDDDSVADGFNMDSRDFRPSSPASSTCATVCLRPVSPMSTETRFRSRPTSGLGVLGGGAVGSP